MVFVTTSQQQGRHEENICRQTPQKVTESLLLFAATVCSTFSVCGEFTVPIWPSCWMYCLKGLQGEQCVPPLMVPTVQVKVGEDATLQCPLLDAFDANPNAGFSILSWYRKTAGGGPELLLSIRASGSPNMTFGLGFGPDKVSAAADGSLLLLAFQRRDSAVYFCSISQGGKHRRDEWWDWFQTTCVGVTLTS